MINMSFLDPQLWAPFHMKSNPPLRPPTFHWPRSHYTARGRRFPSCWPTSTSCQSGRRCEQVRKILPCRCSSLRQPSWRHGTLVCLKAHTKTFGFKNNFKATEESWWIQQPLVTTVSGKVISTSHSLVNILERTYQLNDKQKGRRTCLKPQTWRKTSLFPFSWQGQPVSPSQRVGLPWTCQGRWHLLAGLISLAWN